MKKTLLKPALLFLLAASLVSFFSYYNLSAYLAHEEQLIRLITSCGPLSILVFMLLQAVQVIIAPIPGDVTGFIGGYLYGAALGTLYSTIGLTLGSWLSFSIARRYGLPLVEKIAKPETIQKYDYFMDHAGLAVSCACFLIPGFPKDALCYIIGLSHMRAKIFLLISTLGRLLGTMLLSIAGNSVRQHHNGTFMLSAGIIVLMALFAWLYRDKLHAVLKQGQT